MRGPGVHIHLKRLVNNYNLIKNRLGKKRLVCVVKANAYGHGAVKCSQALEAAGCDYFAVFNVKEALELRAAGIKAEILVFNRLDKINLESAVQKKLTLNLSDAADLDIIIKHHHNTGECPALHLKIDTGMTRLGVSPAAAEAVLEKLALNPQIKIEGLYSHLATADEGDLTFAHGQIDIFERIRRLALELGIKFKYYHLSNSGAILNLDQSNYNIVRVGMLLYGAYPSEEVSKDMPLEAVLEFRAPIVSVRQIEAGTQVSYGGVYVSQEQTTIAVIECGFADGLPRSWYKNKKYKIAGRICMDQFMVDFKGLNPEIGTEVLLLGKGQNGKIKMEDMARTIDSTPYVISTGMGGRAEYIYETD